MKSNVLIVLLFLTACSTKSVSPKKEVSEISFTKVQELVLDQSTKDEVTTILGAPKFKTKEDDREIWVYNHPLKEHARLTAYFDNGSQKLISFIWIPDSSQREKNLDFALSRFNKKDFVPGPNGGKGAHGRPISTVSLLNPSTGVSVVFENETKDVLAIVYAGVASRTPSDEQK